MSSIGNMLLNEWDRNGILPYRDQSPPPVSDSGGGSGGIMDTIFKSTGMGNTDFGKVLGPLLDKIKKGGMAVSWGNGNGLFAGMNNRGSTDEMVDLIKEYLKKNQVSKNQTTVTPASQPSAYRPVAARPIDPMASSSGMMGW